jgi:uncharacterized DUF497 family protein
MMIYEWDEEKNRRNFVKHGLDFTDAEQVLNGPCVTFVDSRFDYGEMRLITLGFTCWSSGYYCPHATRRRYHADYLHEKGKST